MVTKEEILDALRDVIDPEIGINIADLGLVYSAQERDGQIQVTMTMTTAACPMGNMLKDQARNAIKRKFQDIKSVDVELVWAPPWNPGMMSEAAKRKLGRVK